MRQVLEMALEALQHFRDTGTRPSDLAMSEDAITAIKEALAQPKQEPVAWGMASACGGFVIDCISPEEHARVEGSYTIPLYTTPPQRK